MSDFFALLISFFYAAFLLIAAETLRRRFNFSVDFTRKFVHIGAGMAVFGFVVFFETWQAALIPPLAFIALNYVSYRTGAFFGIETGERKHLGTVYFPLAFVILIPLLWTRPVLLVASMMPMTWGDSFAAILGKRLGAHKYGVWGQARSVEGSLAMFGLSFIATLTALTLFGQPIGLGLARAFVVAAAATIAEAIVPYGTDNLAVPLLSAGVLVVMT